MAFPLPEYAQVKDRYCISYFGYNSEYIVQLIHLRPAIENELPGIKIWISCHEHLSYLVKDEKRIVWTSQVEEKKRKFAHIRQVKCDQISHPIWNLLEESKLELPTLRAATPINQEVKKCSIWPTGGLPTKSLSEPQIETVRRLALSRGYHVAIESDIDDCGWVIGVENEALFRAGTMGIKNSLVPTGVGTRLYQRMFPQGEVLKLDL